jgi:hypothetical protein
VAGEAAEAVVFGFCVVGGVVEGWMCLVHVALGWTFYDVCRAQ